MSNPGNAKRILRDYTLTRREAAFLRSIPPLDINGPRVLVVSLFDSVYTIKLELMLATALRLRGWRPIMMCRARYHRLPFRYGRAFGVEDFHFLEDYEPPSSEQERCEAAARRLMDGELTFSAVKEWRFEGAWVGPQLLSTVSRSNMQAAPDPRDPSVASALERLLPETLSSVARARAALDAVNPDLVLVNEANYASYGVVVDMAVARGTDVIQITQPWRDDALMCKRLTPVTRRSHPSSVAGESLQLLGRLPWTAAEERELTEHLTDRYNERWFLQARNQRGTREHDSAQVLNKLGIRPGKRLVTVFSHILWDANLFYGTDLFEDYGDWFVQTVRAACANDSVDWVIKLHPANVWKRAYEHFEGEYSEVLLLRQQVGELPPHVHLLYPDTDISSLSLYGASDVGVTVRGTPGMEMACFGKPVLTAGTGRYAGLGFTVDSESAAEYLQRLATIDQLPALTPEQTLLAKRHAHAVFVLRHWPMRSFRSTFDYAPSGSHPLDHNLRFVARSVADVEHFGDLDKWARWAENRAQVDYLDLAPDAVTSGLGRQA